MSSDEKRFQRSERAGTDLRRQLPRLKHSFCITQVFPQEIAEVKFRYLLPTAVQLFMTTIAATKPTTGSIMTTSLKYMIDPPPGYTRHVTDPPNLHRGLIAVSVSTTVFAFIAVALRLFTRVHVAKNGIQLDDYMVVCALLCSLILLGINFPHMSAGLGYHFWDVRAEKFMSPFQKWTLAGTILYATSLAFTKVSILFFYLRLAPHRWFCSLVRMLVTVVIAYATGYILVSIFGCSPIAASWDLRLVSGATCLDPYTKYMALSVLNIIIDLLVLILPIPVVLPLQMPLRQKILVCTVFATGSFVCAVAIRRTTLLAPLMASTDYTWDAVEQFKWCFTEVNLAIACASAPALKPFFTRSFRPATSSSPLRLPRRTAFQEHPADYGCNENTGSSSSDEDSNYQDWYDDVLEDGFIDDEARLWRSIMGEGFLTTTITAGEGRVPPTSMFGKMQSFFESKLRYQSAGHIHVRSETTVTYESFQKLF